MSIINEELSSLLRDIFYELPNNNNDFLPIIRSSKNIKKIIPFLLKNDTNNEEDINQNNFLLFILKEFFKINTNLIPLFMKESNFADTNLSFYQCITTLFLNESITNENKLVIEELIKNINIIYSLSKSNLEYIYQKLSKYFSNDAKNILTDKLLMQYLNLFNILYTDTSSYYYSKKEKEEDIKNYIYFNGINSNLSFQINYNSCNLNTDFPTLEKGCSFVFWIYLDRNLTVDYFKILPLNTYISFIKINVGGHIIFFQLVSPDYIVISTKDVKNKKCPISNVFEYNKWNNIIFIIEPCKGNTLSTKTYINNNLINGTLTLNTNLDSRQKINSIDLFGNLLGKISSVIFFSFKINTELIEYFSSINGFHKKKIVSKLLNSFDNEYIYKNENEKKNDNEKYNQKIKMKLSEQNILNLICCFCPISYEKKDNCIDDIFGNFIGKLNSEDGVNNYKNVNKNISDLGGINNLLPIIELMLSSLKDNNPYKLIDKNVLTEKTLQEILLIIQKILIGHNKNIKDEKRNHFLSCLSLFLESIPSQYFTFNVLHTIISLIQLPIEKNDIKSGKNSNNFINLILLNERIITKFGPRAQMDLWDSVYEIFKKDLSKVKDSLNATKICLLLRIYDKKKYEKYCCYKHACLFNNGDIDKNQNNIFYPEMNYKVGKLFEIIQLYIDNNVEDTQINDIFKLLSLDLSPCLQKKIIQLYISHFSNPEIQEEQKIKTLNNLLENNYIELSEYALKVSLLDVRTEIVKLFNLLIEEYYTIISEYLKKNSIDIIQIILFFGFNILPDKLILEFDSEKFKDFPEEINNLISINDIKRSTVINEELLNRNKKYIPLNYFFNEEEYNKNMKNFWELLSSSFLNESFDKKTKIKTIKINPLIFKISMDFASRGAIINVQELLMLLLTSIRNESLENLNIFYNDKLFFPWLIDTIFYFHNNDICELLGDKDLITSIRKMSISILDELFTHRREKEITRRLKYILDFSYYHKRNNNYYRLKEVERITRIILIEIFECIQERNDIKSSAIFEFILLYKNSDNIFKEGFNSEEIFNLSEKEFFEIGKKKSENNWVALYKDDFLYNINDELIINDEENITINNLKENNNTNIKNKDIPKLNKNDKDKQIIIGELDPIPNYIFEGINYKEKDAINDIYGINDDLNILENTWEDYKLFNCINSYYKKNVWGIEFLCKNAKIDAEKQDFINISKELFQFYVESKNNREFLNNIILKNMKSKNELNVFYLNIILLSVAIDICDDDEERERLFYDYKQYLLFFILASINLYQDNKTKLNNDVFFNLQKIFNNIIGYGFIFLKKRDKNKFNKFTKELIAPIMKYEGKNALGNKKNFLKKSIIGKLFTITDLSKNNSIVEKAEIRKNISKSVNLGIFHQNKLNDEDDIIFTGDSNHIINEVLEDTINVYKKNKIKNPQSNIMLFYLINNYNGKNNENDNFIGVGNQQMNQKIINEEKRICKTLEEIIPYLDNKIKKYWNNLCLDQLKRRKELKKAKKKLFSWRGFWSNKKMFFEHPEYLKLQVKNHFTKEMTKVLLTPILDIDYYLPCFAKFNKNKLFNKDDYKYKVCLDVEEILQMSENKNENKIEEEENKKEEIFIDNEEVNKKNDIIIEENKMNYNEINIKKEKESNDNKCINSNCSTKQKIKNNIINISNNKNFNNIKKKNSFSNKIQFFKEKLSFNPFNSNPFLKKCKKNDINIVDNNKNKNNNHSNIINIDNRNSNIIKNNINTNILKKEEEIKNNIKEEIKEKKILNNNNNIKVIRNCLAKDFNYLESLYKFTFKGIWDKYKIFYQGKIILDNILLGNRDTFEILNESKLLASSEKNKIKYNIFKCCLVKPTHHIKGYISTENTCLKFTHCEEDTESQQKLENDPSYDKEMKCCFGSTFKKHIKDREKVGIEIYYIDMRYILFRNYFYQQTACEIYTFSNKSFYFNFKDNKDLNKFIENILNYEQYIPIKAIDFKGKKTLGYEKISSENKSKIFKIDKIMEDWQNNEISTLHYIMWLNIFSGRSFNDVTQYPVLPWIITNYTKEELSEEDYRDLGLPVGMMEVGQKSELRKETYIEYYNTLKEDFKEANPTFNYNEYLKKGDEYFTEYKLKKNKKKKDNNNDLGISESNISSIELNQIPYFYGTHYSCPTFVSHYLMRIFPFALLSIEIQGDKFDDPDRIFISLRRTFETASTLKEDVRELIPEFYTLPEMFLNKNNLNLTQDKLDSEGKAVIVNDVDLPPWCNNLSFTFVIEMRNNLEKNTLAINKWIDLIFGSLQRGEKAEENHNIYMAHTYEGMVKIDTITDYDSRNALMRLWEVGVTPKQIFKTDSKRKNEKSIIKGSTLYDSQNLYITEGEFFKYGELIKNCYKNKTINNEYEEKIYPKIIKIKAIGLNELILVYNLHYITKIKYKKISDKKFVFDEKIIYKGNNYSSIFTSFYLMSHYIPPIIIYNNNRYMIKGGFWDGKLEIYNLIIEQKEKEKNLSNIIKIKEGPIVVMEMTKDEKTLLCGIKTGHLIIFSVDGLELEKKNNIFLHTDEITSISINDNLNMFATSSLDGYINIHILPSFDLVRSIKISEDNIHSYANNIFLSSSPLACITAFISSKKIFRIFTINGEFIGDNQINNTTENIKCPIVFNDLYFQDYLIYGTDDGRIEIRKFPEMDLKYNKQITEGNDIISMDISPDKKFCFIWSKDNKISIITDLTGTNNDNDDKKK